MPQDPHIGCQTNPIETAMEGMFELGRKREGLERGESAEEQRQRRDTTVTEPPMIMHGSWNKHMAGHMASLGTLSMYERVCVCMRITCTA